MNGLALEKYGWKSASPEHSHKYLLPACIKILQDHAVTSLLDVGAGNGSMLPTWLAQGLKVAAMEPDEDGFLYSSQHSKVDVRKYSVGERLPIEWQNAFDAVISLEVVEHLFDPLKLVHTINETINDNGIVIVSTPYHGYLKNLALALGDKWDFHHHPVRTGGHIKFWSRRTLTELFVGNGFRKISFQGVGRFPFLWKSMIMVFKKSH